MVDLKEMREAALIGVSYWLDCSPHERDEATGMSMARYIRAMQWQLLETAPTDGTEVLVTDGEHVWIDSQRVGHSAGPSRGGQPTSGRLFAWKHDKPVIAWAPIPIPPNG